VVDTIEIKCPYCNHQAAPPVYPYCEHVVFVYVDPAVDDYGFDFITVPFASVYLSKLKKTRSIPLEERAVTPEEENRFLQAILPTGIKLFKNLISEDLFSSDAIVFDVKEEGGYYPTRVVVAFQASPASE